MLDVELYERKSSDDETNRALTDDELLYLNAGYVYVDEAVQPNSDWCGSAESKESDK